MNYEDKFQILVLDDEPIVLKRLGAGSGKSGL